MTTSSQFLNSGGNHHNLLPSSVLPLSFYQQPSLIVAEQLLGKYLVLKVPDSPNESNDGISNYIVGIIEETEAYLGIGDRASHSSKGRTPRTKVLFGEAGTIYVYLIYGIYHCLNVVTDTPESGGAVLIRSLIPVRGIEGKTSGPGLLCKSLGITLEFNGQSIVTSDLTIQRPHTPISFDILRRPRIGVDYAGPDKDLPYRFTIAKAS